MLLKLNHIIMYYVHNTCKYIVEKLKFFFTLLKIEKYKNKMFENQEIKKLKNVNKIKHYKHLKMQIV